MHDEEVVVFIEQKFIPIKIHIIQSKEWCGALSNGTNITQIDPGKVPDFACNKDTSSKQIVVSMNSRKLMLRHTLRYKC